MKYSAEDTKWFYLGVAIHQMQPSELRREAIVNGLKQFPQGIQVDGNWTVKSSDPDFQILLEDKKVKIVNRVIEYTNIKYSTSWLVIND